MTADKLDVRGIPFLELLQDPNLDPAGITVFGDGADDFYGDLGAGVSVDGLDDLAERSLAEETDGAICRDEGR